MMPRRRRTPATDFSDSITLALTGLQAGNTTLLERKDYDRFRVAPLDPATLRAKDVERILKQVSNGSDGRLSMEKFAESIEGRPIYLAKIGTGPKQTLLWSQMHGDEPTHTAVLLDLASYLLQKPAAPMAEEILKNCTLHFI